MTRSIRTSHERFVWPPRPLADIEPTAETACPRPARTIQYPELAPLESLPFGRWRRAWRGVEAAWLGFAAAPLSDRAAAADWLPDALEEFCPRCAATLGPNEATEGRCTSCEDRRLPWSRAVRLGSHEGLLRELIHDIKFTAWRTLGTEVGRLLGHTLDGALTESGVDRSRTVLVAMPTTYARRFGRGIDHARVIARGVREVTGLPIVPALDRSHRRSQVSVPASRRRANVAGSFRAVPGISLGGLTVVVIDDVMTTGSTMTAACKAIWPGGRGGIKQTRSSFGRDDGPAAVWAAVAAVARRPGGGGGRAEPENRA